MTWLIIHWLDWRDLFSRKAQCILLGVYAVVAGICLLVAWLMRP